MRERTVRKREKEENGQRAGSHVRRKCETRTSEARNRVCGIRESVAWNCIGSVLAA